MENQKQPPHVRHQAIIYVSCFQILGLSANESNYCKSRVPWKKCKQNFCHFQPVCKLITFE